MNIDVLLTRPVGDNESLAARLTSEGMQCDILPMLEITPVDLSSSRGLISDLDRFDHVIFVSRNAVRHGLPAIEDFWPQWPAHLTWYAVGEATASELRDEGIDPLVPDRENSEGLLDLAPLQDISDQKILIVRGVDGREVLAQGLESRGARVTYLEVHQRRAAKIERFDREAYEESPPSVTVVYSGSILESLVLNLGVLDTTLVVPSARVGEEAREAGFERVVVARGANESDMVDAVLSTRS